MQINFENDVHAFFCVMQEKDPKLKLEALRALQQKASPAIRKRIANEIPRVERETKWGEVAKKFPEPPSAA